MKSTTRFGAAVAVAAALIASALVATPAHAATPLSGRILDAGAAVANASIVLSRFDASTQTWTGVDSDSTDAAGAFSLTAPTDGQYATNITLNGTTVQFASDQTWDGRYTDNNMYTTQFTVSGGASSLTDLTTTLRRNAGIFQVTLTDAGGTPFSGTGAEGWGDVEAQSGVIEGTGYADALVSGYEERLGFDGTIVIPRIPAGYYPELLAETRTSAGVNQISDTLEPVTIVAGQLTNYGSFVLHAPGTPYAAINSYPSISGALKVGSLLTAVASTTPVVPSLSYVWFADGIPIAGASAPTITLTPKQLGQGITVTARYRQAGHVSNTSSTPYPSVPVTLGDPDALSVAISGAAKYGSKLRVNVTSPLGGTRQLQWYRNGTPIQDADGTTYVVDKADLGASIFVSAKSTVQGHSDAVIPSAALTIGKETVTLKAKTKTKIKTKTVPKVTVTVKASASGLSATAKVKVYYTSTKFKSVTVKSGKSATVKLPKLKKGTTNLKVVYPATAYYNAKTITIKVKVSK